MRLARRLIGHRPGWARTDQPQVRYELDVARRPVTPQTRWLRLFGMSIAILGLFFVGYLLASDGFSHPPGQNFTETLRAVVFWPMVVLQIIAQIVVLLLTVSMVSDQRRRQSWDNLRATVGGVGLALRARWTVTVYHRMRPLMMVIYGVRLVMILGMLVDLTAFQGHYIDLLLDGVTPAVAPAVGVLLLAFMMTAALLLPLSNLSLDASVGLLLATTVQQRTYSVMAQIVLVIIRIAVVAMLILLVALYMSGELGLDPVVAWLLMAAFAVVGDWGLSFLHLGLFSSLWWGIPYSLLLGVALLVFALLQTRLADAVLNYAVRRAERVG